MTSENDDKVLLKFAGFRFRKGACDWLPPNEESTYKLYPDAPDFTDLTTLFKWCVPKLPNGTEINIIWWDGSSGVGTRFRGETEWHYGENYGCELNVYPDKEYGGGGRTPGEALRQAMLEFLVE